MSGVPVDCQTAQCCSEQAWVRTIEIAGALERSDDQELDEATLLPDWTRLTIACHLRYGARASARMTLDAVEGRETSFYPENRSKQRPGTLGPGDGESPSEVVRSLLDESRHLHELWSELDPSQWDTEVREPSDNPDLGGVSIGVLAVLRLTEVEVHGVDLDLDLSDWSHVFVGAALPLRLAMLATRRRDPSRIDPLIEGSWLLDASDGPAWTVSSKLGRVNSARWDGEVETDATIQGTTRNILALLLGRPRGHLVLTGNAKLARSFGEAFPGP